MPRELSLPAAGNRKRSAAAGRGGGARRRKNEEERGKKGIGNKRGKPREKHPNERRGAVESSGMNIRNQSRHRRIPFDARNCVVRGGGSYKFNFPSDFIGIVKMQIGNTRPGNGKNNGASAAQGYARNRRGDGGARSMGDDRAAGARRGRARALLDAAEG